MIHSCGFPKASFVLADKVVASKDPAFQPPQEQFGVTAGLCMREDDQF